MPWAAKKHCPHGHPPFTGSQCPVCAKQRKQRYDSTRPSAHKRLYTAAWQSASKAFLAKHKVCVSCGAPSEVVDHKIAHKGNRDLFWDRTNWQPMCKPCNSRKAAKEEGGFGNPMREGASKIYEQRANDRVGSHARNLPEIGGF